jgi:hypothetical protein
MVFSLCLRMKQFCIKVSFKRRINTKSDRGRLEIAIHPHNSRKNYIYKSNCFIHIYLKFLQINSECSECSIISYTEKNMFVNNIAHLLTVGNIS